MTHQKTKHLCDFCNREYTVIKNAERHEMECYRNPSQEACVTCAHFRYVEKWATDDGIPDIYCKVYAMPTDLGQSQMTNHCGKWEAK